VQGDPPLGSLGFRYGRNAASPAATTPTILPGAPPVQQVWREPGQRIHHSEVDTQTALVWRANTLVSAERYRV